MGMYLGGGNKSTKLKRTGGKEVRSWHSVEGQQNLERALRQRARKKVRSPGPGGRVTKHEKKDI